MIDSNVQIEVYYSVVIVKFELVSVWNPYQRS